MTGHNARLNKRTGLFYEPLFYSTASQYCRLCPERRNEDGQPKQHRQLGKEEKINHFMYPGRIAGTGKSEERRTSYEPERVHLPGSQEGDRDAKCSHGGGNGIV